jgi:hypothetical protein
MAQTAVFSLGEEIFTDIFKFWRKAQWIMYWRNLQLISFSPRTFVYYWENNVVYIEGAFVYEIHVRKGYFVLAIGVILLDVASIDLVSIVA